MTLDLQRFDDEEKEESVVKDVSQEKYVLVLDEGASLISADSNITVMTKEKAERE